MSNVHSFAIAGSWTIALAGSVAEAACPVAVGDVTGDGAATVVDVQCIAQVALWSLGGGGGSPPACSFTEACAADANCSGSVDLVDLVAAIHVALGLPLMSFLDKDADGCPDACEVAAPGELCIGCGWQDPEGCERWLWDGAACVAGEPLHCDDCNPCTADACKGGQSCSFSPVNVGLACDDFDACTGGDLCTPSGVCLGSAAGAPPGCGTQSSVLCSLVGAAGTMVDCPIGLARWPGTPAAAAIQLSFSFDAQRVHVVDFVSEHCFDELQACIDISAVGSFQPVTFPPTAEPVMALPSGHAISVSPGSVEDWAPKECVTNADCALGAGPCTDGMCPGGFGTLVAVHLSDPHKALTNAVVTGFGWDACVDPGNGPPVILGAPTFLKARFTLVEPIDPANPVGVTIAWTAAVTGSGLTASWAGPILLTKL